MTTEELETFTKNQKIGLEVIQKSFEEERTLSDENNRCGQSHNNDDDEKNCLQCQVYKFNI